MAIESCKINRADSLPAGDYRYLERVTNPTTGKLTTSAEGVVKVEINLALAAAGACISHAERVLAIIEAQRAEALRRSPQLLADDSLGILRPRPLWRYGEIKRIS